MTGIIILAAGSSSRLGSPKQNLIYKERTLLQKAVEAALNSICEPAIVVLGADEDIIEPTIQNKLVQIVFNANWEEGMASSIRTGIEALKKMEPTINAVVLMLCDQPFVDAAIINLLVEAKTDQTDIIACAYNDTIGPPALFDTHYFDELLLLKGHEGAKKLLMKYIDKVVSIPFDMGGVDIDTKEDYGRLNAL